MAKIFGFDNKYEGQKETEAWEKIYEFGKNFMPIKENKLQKQYNKMFNKYTKVVREGILKKILTDRIVPNDIIVIEKGDFVPADGEVLEEKSLEFDKKFKEDTEVKMVYQGMHVKQGKSILKVTKTGENTYLGGFVKQIDDKKIYKTNIEKSFHIYINIIGIIGIVLLIFGMIFSFVTTEGDIITRLGISSISGILLFLVALPIGPALMFLLKMFEQKIIMRKSNMIVNKKDTLLNAHRTTVICLDERFLGRNYEKYIQRFYSAGIMIAFISSKSKEEMVEIAKNAGVIEDEFNSISGNEIEGMIDEKLYQVICNTVIFYEVNESQKMRILKGFNDLNIKTLNIIDELKDLPTLKYTDVEICTHNRKKTLEYELSNANIIDTELTSIYSLIKGSFIIKNYFNHFAKYYIMFHFPVILSLLVALLYKISVQSLYFQTIAFIVFIVPLLLLLVNRNYSDDKIFELKNRNETFFMSCIKFGFVGFGIGIVAIGCYILLSLLNLVDAIKINLVTILLFGIDATIIMLSRRKFGVKKEKKIKEKTVKNNERDIKEKTVEDKKVSDKEKKLKKAKNIKIFKGKIPEEKGTILKVMKERRIKVKKNVDDMRDKML